MKDSAFIELLNLYLDHEISAADAAKLEAEVQTNAARRRIYQQYCRMQKACKMVAADFQTDSEGAIAANDRKVVAFHPGAASGTAGQRKRVNAIYAMGTFAAAAACVAIIFVSSGRQDAIPAQNEWTAEVTPAAPAGEAKADSVAAEASAPRGLVSVAQRPAATLVANPLLLTGNTQAQAVLAAAVRQADNQLAWLETVHLAPLQKRTPVSNNLRFDATLGIEGRALGNRASMPMKHTEPAEDMVTFQFMK
jgi:hypothetical protein